MDKGVIVAGAGHAAGEFAFKLRQNGFSAPILLIGAESHLPYQRPPLSKGFLSGDIDQAELLLRPESTYHNANIHFLGGTRVLRIDRDAHTVNLSSGATHGYDKLVLATGGSARKLTCRGAELDGVFYLRAIKDVDGIRRHMQPGKRLVIIGGGYVGLEVAAVAVRAGLDVVVVEAAPRVLPRVTGPEISAFYQNAHSAAGVTIYTASMVESLGPAKETPGHVGTVKLSDGRVLLADFVIAGIGLLPNVDLASGSGLHVDNGIWVDEYCRTSDEDILAIGDCSNHPSPFLGRRVRLESVPNAVEQARVAADTLCGRLAPYAGVPWFWSDQYDLKLQAVGISENYDQVVQRGSCEARSFTMFYLRNGIVIAADSVNKAADFMAAKKIVGQKLRVRVDDLIDTARPLKETIAMLTA